MLRHHYCHIHLSFSCSLMVSNLISTLETFFSLYAFCYSSQHDRHLRELLLFLSILVATTTSLGYKAAIMNLIQRLPHLEIPTSRYYELTLQNMIGGNQTLKLSHMGVREGCLDQLSKQLLATLPHLLTFTR